jgi:hypothetical protein
MKAPNQIQSQKNINLPQNTRKPAIQALENENQPAFRRLFEE